MQLAGKRIIVTGSAQGIGQAAVDAFVAEGAHVFALDSNDVLGAQAAQAANARGPGTAKFLQVDVSNRAQVDAAFAAAAAELGGSTSLPILPACIAMRRRMTFPTIF